MTTAAATRADYGLTDTEKAAIGIKKWANPAIACQQVTPFDLSCACLFVKISVYSVGVSMACLTAIVAPTHAGGR